MSTNIQANTEENEKRVRAFYEATVPGHRESLRGLQAPHVVYDMPEGMPDRMRPFRGPPGRARAVSHQLLWSA